MAIEHHGLMPPITTLSDSELNQITDYLLTLTPEKGGMTGEMKGNKGKGMQMDKDKQTGQERKHKKHGSN